MLVKPSWHLQNPFLVKDLRIWWIKKIKYYIKSVYTLSTNIVGLFPHTEKCTSPVHWEWINELSWQHYRRKYDSEWISFLEPPRQCPTEPGHQARFLVAAGLTGLCSWQREVHRPVHKLLGRYSTALWGSLTLNELKQKPIKPGIRKFFLYLTQSG